MESMDMKVELQSHGKGKFGRILGEFFCNDVNINKQMVNSGHAVNYDGGKR
jgi:endonuclease YncB( thermonuclease family)